MRTCYLADAFVLRDDAFPARVQFLGDAVLRIRPSRSTPTSARIFRALAGGTPRRLAVSRRESGLKSSFTGRRMEFSLNSFLILSR
jgi:hypothetical protein